MLCVTAVVLGADVLLRSGARWWEGLIAAACAVAALPRSSALSWGEYVVIEVRYLTRRRVRRIAVDVEDDALRVVARGARRVWCYDFVHHGRLDLAGHDVALASRLARTAESLAESGERAHVALRVESSAEVDAAVRTVICLSVPSPPSSEWRRDPRAGLSPAIGAGVVALVERRDYVRTPHDVVRTLRAVGFAEATPENALEVLSERFSWLSISLHATVLPRERARRVTSRAVHRIDTDARFARGAGYRWSAHHERRLEALSQREYAVASGAALCHWALYVVVRAPTLDELKERVDETLGAARGAGLRLEKGVGLQYEWLLFQAPGGPGW